MPTQRFDAIGGVGLITDLHPAANEGWSSCRNIIPRNNRITTGKGATKLFDLAIEPRWSTTHRQPDGTQYLIVNNGSSTWAYTSAGVGEDITQDTAGTIPYSNKISFCNLNGVLCYNSLADGPYYWPGPGSPLTPLPGWDFDEWRCHALASYRYYLVAGGMVENRSTTDDYYAHKLRWSTAAADGDIPAEWVADPANEAGDDLLGESNGAIIGMLPIQDSLWIIKEDAIYSMDWVGLPYIMQTRKLRGALNLHTPKETAEYLGSLIAMSGRDLIWFDGAQVRSLVKGKVQEALVDLIGVRTWASAAVLVDPFINYLYVLGRATYIDQYTEALVLDLDNQAWGRMDLNYAFGAVSMPYAAGPSDPEIALIIMLESNEANTEHWASLLDNSASNSLGVPLQFSVERTGIPLEGAEGLAMITEGWVEATGDADTIDVYIGAQWTLDDAMRWDGPHVVTPNRQQHINPRITGRYFGYRLESSSRQNWEAGSLTLRWSPAGER